jgi:hypothetical protein
MPEILDESLQEKLPAEVAEYRHLSKSDVEYVLEKYIPKEEEDKYWDMLHELDEFDNPIPIKALDDAHFVERYVPADKVDEAETKLLESRDPVDEIIDDIKWDVEKLEEAYGSLYSDWVKRQFMDFLDQLRFNYPRDAEQYMAIKDKSIMDM